MQIPTCKNQNGYAAITAVLFVMLLSATILGSFSFFAIKEVNASRLYRKSIDAQAISESGLEDVVYRVVKGKQYGTSETVAVGNGTTTITITPSGNQKIIRSVATKDNLTQTMETLVETDTVGASFVYGVYVGNGGIEMENTSQITGSIYSNGSITGNNSPVITGDAFAAGTSVIQDALNIQGNARAHAIADVTINGYASSTTFIQDTTTAKSATANTFDQGVINGNAYYKTSVSANTTVTGQKILIGAAPTDLPVLPMPIPDSQLDEWEEDAVSGGTHSGSCPYTIDSGTVSLGSIKIPCDLTIKGTAIVTLTGPLWIAGNLTVENSAQVRLNSSFGTLSGLIIADDPANRGTKGMVDIKNSAQILGSGQNGSYVMVVSRNNSSETGGGNTAISVQNSSSASIYYAPHGSVRIQNNTTLKEVIAHKLELKNSATVSYESGLQSVQFSSGPTGGYDIKYWKRTK